MDKNIIQIPNNLRIGHKPTKELIDEGVPANSALVGAAFYFDTEQGVKCVAFGKDSKAKCALLVNALAGPSFDFITEEPRMQIPVKIVYSSDNVCTWMR